MAQERKSIKLTNDTYLKLKKLNEETKVPMTQLIAEGINLVIEKRNV